jgi:hypothetical protein
MNSSMIGKIEKARRYAEEPERVKFQSFNVTFKGTHDDYTVTMDGADFHCNCHFFEHSGEGTCCHVMAMQRLLAPMMSEEQQKAGTPFSFASV